MLNTIIFLPSGGSGVVRESLVKALDVRTGHRVLELGCGTGQVTASLLAAGAHVVAVDRLPAMLDRARTRASGAAFIEGDAIAADVGGGYDRAVLSFVLHNYDSEGRMQLLRRAAAALVPGGLIGVLEWAVPSGRARAALWRRFLEMLEPASERVQQVLNGALDAEIVQGDLRVADRRRIAGGRAQILLLRRSE